jgi:hypothetical protein
MKKALLLILTLCATSVLSAQTFTNNGIKYEVISPTSVMVQDNRNFSGAAIIPSSVTNASITYSVVSIATSAFLYNSTLTSVIIPNSVSGIGSQAFRSCTNLSSVSLPNSLVTISEGAFNVCTNLKSINIPNSVKTIGNGAFDFCSNLTTINIGNSVTTIGTAAFISCTSLKTINIPNSVKWIGGGLFTYCSNLKSVIVNWQTPLDITTTPLDIDTISKATLYVPIGTVDAYKAATGWKDFGTIIESTLPLTLTSLTAKAVTNGNQINWASANVVNVKNITLQRSGTNNNFSFLNSLPATASQFVDINPLAGDNYYRLSTTDNDGTITTYPQIAFVKGLANDISFYPNPITNGILNVVAGSSKIETIALFDLNGKKVVFVNTKSNPKNLSLQTQGLAKGMYVLEIKDEKTTTHKKVVVN